MKENRIKGPLKRMPKQRCRIKSLLKDASKAYGDDHTKEQEMSLLMAQLKMIDSVKLVNKSEKNHDRFEKYLEEVEEPVQDAVSGSKLIESNCTFEDFESVFEPGNTEQIEDTVEEKIGEIKELLGRNKVVVLEGNTGCGKTTRIPRLLMADYDRIVCTQPRKLAAISVARKVASDMGCDLGTTVGYSVRFDNKSSDATKLKFVTDGILIKEVCSIKTHKKTTNRKIAGYDLIVIDEAHERTVNIDLLLGIIKMMLKDETIQTKMLIMSATLNTDRLIEYFGCSLVTIRHKPHDIEYFYLKQDCKDYTLASATMVKELIRREATGDILVFLTGQEEIERAYRLLVELKTPSLLILKLFSTMPAEEQDLIFKGAARKIVLSTNIAETSITIENVKFVIDCGKFKSKEYSVSDDIDYLDILVISKAQAKQRAGRAGRTQPGKVFRIYSHETYKGMRENPAPEILRTRLHSTVLAMKTLGIVNIYDFDYIDKPFISALKKAEAFLYYIRAIDENGVIKRFGKRLVRLPLEPETALSLFAAQNIGCFNSVATIAAFLEFQTPFLDMKPDDPNYLKLRTAKSAFTNPKGDFYTFLAIFYSWQQSKFSKSFIRRNFLNMRTMIQILNMRDQILRLFPETTDININIEAAFSTGFFMKTAKAHESCYRTLFGDVECYLSSKDPLFLAKPKYVIFYGIFYNRKEYMVHCLEVSAYNIYSSINNFKIPSKMQIK